MAYIKVGTLVFSLSLILLTGNGMLCASDEAPKQPGAPSGGASAAEGVQERAVPFGPGMVAPPPRTIGPIPYDCDSGKRKCTCYSAYDCGIMGGAHVCVPGTFTSGGQGGSCTERQS